VNNHVLTFGANWSVNVDGFLKTAGAASVLIIEQYRAVLVQLLLICCRDTEPLSFCRAPISMTGKREVHTSNAGPFIFSPLVFSLTVFLLSFLQNVCYFSLKINSSVLKTSLLFNAERRKICFSIYRTLIF